MHLHYLHWNIQTSIIRITSSIPNFNHPSSCVRTPSSFSDYFFIQIWFSCLYLYTSDITSEESCERNATRNIVSFDRWCLLTYSPLGETPLWFMMNCVVCSTFTYTELAKRSLIVHQPLCTQHNIKRFKSLTYSCVPVSPADDFNCEIFFLSLFIYLNALLGFCQSTLRPTLYTFSINKSSGIFMCILPQCSSSTLYIVSTCRRDCVCLMLHRSSFPCLFCTAPTYLSLLVGVSLCECGAVVSHKCLRPIILIRPALLSTIYKLCAPKQP